MSTTEALAPSRLTVEWAKLITELEAEGISAYKIAGCLGIRVNQLERIRVGSEPKYTIGLTLISLHALLVKPKTST